MVGYKLVWCPEKQEDVTRFIEQDFAPLLEKHWAFMDIENAGIDIQAFMQIWISRGCTLVMAYEGDKAVGFLIGWVFRPVFVITSALHVERWYAEDEEVIAGMFDYLKNAADIMGIRQVHIAKETKAVLPDSVLTDPEDSYQMLRMRM